MNLDCHGSTEDFTILEENSLAKNYVIKDDKIVRNRPFCPRCGDGVFMADKGEWWSCGKCGDRYKKSSFRLESISPAHVSRENCLLKNSARYADCGKRYKQSSSRHGST